MINKKQGCFRKRIFAKHGFTLSEVLIGLQLMSLITILAYAVFKLFQMSYLRQIKELNLIRQESYDYYDYYINYNRIQNPMTEPRSNIGK